MKPTDPTMPGPEGPPARHADDSRLHRFDDPRVRRTSAWLGVAAVGVTVLLLVLFAGGAVNRAAQQISPGVGRDVIDAVGAPAELIADATPLADARRDLTGGLSPDPELTGAGFTDAVSGARGGPAPVTAEYFDPAELGEAPPPPTEELTSLLVTGDSMSIPLDAELARRLESDGVETTRDPRLGSGISQTDFVDWAKLSATQAREGYDAVVMFLGAGDGYAMPGPNGETVRCCGADWAAIYANRVRQVMQNYRASGARVYWLTVPTPRDQVRARNTVTVNAALGVAAQPLRQEVEVIDLVPVFTPGNEYRAAIEIDGSEQIVRASDGLHLNEAGARVAADHVEEELSEDFVR